MNKKIGINLLYLNPKLAGGSFTYAVNLINNISIIDKVTEYVIYLNEDCVGVPFDLSSNFTKRILPFKYKNVYIRYLWEQFVLPFYVVRDKIQLLHSLGYVGPILCPVKKVVSILDINYKGHGANMGTLKKLLLGTTINFTAKTSKHIITISDFSKKQIIKYIGIPSEKITVTLLSGTSDIVCDRTNNIDVKAIYGIDGRYIIAFSGTSSHKNINNLISSYCNVLTKLPDIKLVLVGHKTKGKGIEDQVRTLKLEENIIFTGFVPDEHIDSLINNADLFVFPSLYEGFGIPILDAQSQSTPVSSSNAGSLPEVGGSGPLYFDPLNLESMSDSIISILSNKDLAKDVVQKGLINRSKFSWRKTALDTLSIYHKI